MTKRRIVMIVVLTLISYCVLAVLIKWIMHVPGYFYSSGNSDGPQLSRAIYLLDLEDVYAIELYNDAGGFHGDGIELYSVDVDDKKLKIAKKWEPLPNTTYKNHIEWCDYINYDFLSDYLLNLDNGRFKFIDRNPDRDYSENYIMGIYDENEGKIYILIVNT